MIVGGLDLKRIEMKPKLRLYNVYFDQINRIWYKIKATDVPEALEKAKAKWNKSNLPPVYFIEGREDSK